MTRWYTHFMNGKPDPRRAPEWEQAEMYGGFGGYQGPLRPTHWMPLPEAPNAALTGAADSTTGNGAE